MFKGYSRLHRVNDLRLVELPLVIHLMHMYKNEYIKRHLHLYICYRYTTCKTFLIKTHQTQQVVDTYFTVNPHRELLEKEAEKKLLLSQFLLTIDSVNLLKWLYDFSFTCRCLAFCLTVPVNHIKYCCWILYM